MIIETITVTTTPTSLAALIATARSWLTMPTIKCSKVKFIVGNDTTAIVSAKDGTTENPVVILNAQEGLYTSEVNMFNLGMLYLVASTSVTVGVVVEQGRVG